MDRATILLQLDTDAQPSVFDRVVAVDAGVEHLFSHGGVTPEAVAGLVHGCIFTRSARHLHRTAVFVGGSDVAAGEQVLAAIRKAMIPQFGLQVSVMLDSNGCNTTAAAAVKAASDHVDLASANALVLGGTGPVGQRVAFLLAAAGAHVRVGSRQRERAEAVCAAVRRASPSARVEPVGVGRSADGPAALAGRDVVVAAGAAGTVLLPKSVRQGCPTLKVAIDLNAVPPLGVEGVEATDKAAERDGVVCYGALGVGGLKMQVHKAAVQQLFTRNDLVIDAEQAFAIARGLS